MTTKMQRKIALYDRLGEQIQERLDRYVKYHNALLKTAIPHGYGKYQLHEGEYKYSYNNEFHVDWELVGNGWGDSGTYKFPYGVLEDDQYQRLAEEGVQRVLDEIAKEKKTAEDRELQRKRKLLEQLKAELGEA